MDRRDWLKAFAAAGTTALLLSLIMLPTVQDGLMPFPRPLAIAFADLLFDAAPAAAGLLLHLIYVTAWGLVYILLFRDRFTFSSALVLGLVLWILALVFFFPLVGWGLFGFAIGPHLITAALIPHLLFSLLLWGFCRLFFRSS